MQTGQRLLLYAHIEMMLVCLLVLIRRLEIFSYKNNGL